MGERRLRRGGIAAAVFCLLVLVVFVFVVVLQNGRAGNSQNPSFENGAADRIISMVPSVTEVLFALGRGDRVVGVTSYCNYPPEALTKTRLGGYGNPNYEAIVALNPDLVVTMPEQSELRRRLKRLGIETVEVDQGTIDGILTSIVTLGRICDVEAKAHEMVAGLRARLRLLSAKTQGLTRPRVLVCVGRPVGSGRLAEVHVAGACGFLNELITRAGGVNASSDRLNRYPAVSHEGLIVMNPQVIIDMLPELSKQGVSPEAAIAQWNELPTVEAVKNQRVHAITEDYAVIPGPRFIRILERITRCIHPDVEL